jgi:AcrR family transcriptional regulator
LVATEVFLDKGYDCTSMDEVAAKAAISKPTVCEYFSDKQQLFAEVVHATARVINDLMRLIAESMAGTNKCRAGRASMLPLFVRVSSDGTREDDKLRNYLPAALESAWISSSARPSAK